jgi:hypothetical protein
MARRTKAQGQSSMILMKSQLAGDPVGVSAARRARGPVETSYQQAKEGRLSIWVVKLTCLGRICSINRHSAIFE